MMFVPLHVKSGYSLGYGTASVAGLVQSAADCGYGALALTDRENLSGQVQFHHHCRICGIHPICGVELLVKSDTGDGANSGRMVLLAMDGTGYRHLCRIVPSLQPGHWHRFSTLVYYE